MVDCIKCIGASEDIWGCNFKFVQICSVKTNNNNCKIFLHEKNYVEYIFNKCVKFGKKMSYFTITACVNGNGLPLFSK